MQIVLSFAIVIAVAFVLWRSSQPKWSMRIDVTPNRLPVVQGVALTKAQQIAEFVKNDLLVDERITILATREKSGYLRTKITGRLDRGTYQQIRNFLVDIL